MLHLQPTILGSLEMRELAFTPKEACKTALNSITLLLILQPVVSPLAN